MFLYKSNHTLQYGNILQYTHIRNMASTRIVTSLVCTCGYIGGVQFAT